VGYRSPLSSRSWVRSKCVRAQNVGFDNQSIIPVVFEFRFLPFLPTRSHAPRIGNWRGNLDRIALTVFLEHVQEDFGRGETDGGGDGETEETERAFSEVMEVGYRNDISYLQSAKQFAEQQPVGPRSAGGDSLSLPLFSRVPPVPTARPTVGLKHSCPISTADMALCLVFRRE
jgi:hypothetical protein